MKNDRNIHKGTSISVRPMGRTLSDFGALSSAETLLLNACARGESAFVTPEQPYQLPKAATDENVIRPNFLRFLALGGDGAAPVHEMGVRIYGAWIVGDLDLQFCDLPYALGVDWCMIEGAINLTRTRARTLRFNGSMVREITADGLCCTEGMFLRRGFYVHQGVRLLEARIGGALDCSGSRFEGGGGIALNCDGVRVDGSVHLNWEEWNGKLFRFNACGSVHFSGAKITGELNCDGGRFDGNGAFALVCDSAEIDRSVFIRSALTERGPLLLAPNKFLTFEALGTVRFVHAHIGGDLDCLGAHFDASNGHALVCDEAVISGRMLFRESPQDGFVIPLSVSGEISLNGTTVGVLVDDLQSWGKATALDIDNFQYNSIASVSPNDVKSRIAWLEMQRADYLGINFAHQPWTQLARVFEQANRNEDGKIVRIEMRKRQRLRRWRDQRKLHDKIWWFAVTRFDWLLGLLVGYGYRPWRAVWAIITIWAIGGLIFASVAPFGIMIPSDSKIYLDKAVPAECRTDWGTFTGPLLPSAVEITAVFDPDKRAQLQQQVNADLARRNEAAKRLNFDGAIVPTWIVICKRAVPPEFTKLAPFLYSLDLVVPLLDLHQKDRWNQQLVDINGEVFRPLNIGNLGVGHVVRVWQWFETLAGLFLSLLLAATVSGIIKKD
jgi:hypothetical protein